MNIETSSERISVDWMSRGVKYKCCLSSERKESKKTLEKMAANEAGTGNTAIHVGKLRRRLLSVPLGRSKNLYAEISSCKFKCFRYSYDIGLKLMLKMF